MLKIIKCRRRLGDSTGMKAGRLGKCGSTVLTRRSSSLFQTPCQQQDEVDAKIRAYVQYTQRSSAPMTTKYKLAGSDILCNPAAELLLVAAALAVAEEYISGVVVTLRE